MWRGGQMVKAHWHFLSSQLCHQCGAQGVKLTLDVRTWLCLACGSLLDRGGNAALNLRDWPGATRPLPVDTNGKTSYVEALAVEAGTESLERRTNHG